MANETVRRITERLEQLGQSERAASLAAGLGPDAIRDIRRSKSRRPTFETLSALARYFQCSIEDLTGSEDIAHVIGQTVIQGSLSRKPFARLEDERGRLLPSKHDDWLFRFYDVIHDIELLPEIPVFSSTGTEPDGSALRTNGPTDWTERPGTLSSDVFAAAYIVPDASMSPALEEGQVVISAGSVDLKNKDSVLTTMTGRPRFIIRRILDIDADTYRVRRFNPLEDEVLSRLEWYADPIALVQK